MAQAKEGDKVIVHYTGMLESGEVFDSSMCTENECDCDSGPLEFTIGMNEVIPGFEKGVVGMSPGESKTVNIPVEDAYGHRNDQLVGVVERGQIPPDLNPEVGMRFEVTQEDGQEFPVVVTEVTDTHVTLDANHPLAGKALTFDIEVLEIT